jgi:hypothetical protein
MDMNKRLELEIVRVAETNPDTVDIGRIDGWGSSKPNGVRCLVGEACYRLFGYSVPSWSPLTEEIWQATRANDRGIPWGQIPKLVGLVPGEAPAEEVAVPETVEV